MYKYSVNWKDSNLKTGRRVRQTKHVYLQYLKKNGTVKQSVNLCWGGVSIECIMYSVRCQIPNLKDFTSSFIYCKDNITCDSTSLHVCLTMVYRSPKTMLSNSPTLWQCSAIGKNNVGKEMEFCASKWPWVQDLRN